MTRTNRLQAKSVTLTKHLPDCGWHVTGIGEVVDVTPPRPLSRYIYFQDFDERDLCRPLDIGLGLTAFRRRRNSSRSRIASGRGRRARAPSARCATQKFHL